MASDPLYPFRRSLQAHAFATGTAIEDSRAVGLDLRLNDWRDIFLSITDTLACDGTQSLAQIGAAFVGPVRDGERWTITFGRRTFDVLYNPDRAQVYRVLPPRNPDHAAAVSPPPRTPVDAGTADCS
jgi:hypothetical protein